MMDLDAPDLIASFGGTYTITRRAAANVVDTGIAVPGESTTLQVLACFWPAKGADLQRLPELRRTEATLSGVCDTKLMLGGQGSAYEADLVEIDDEQWEIQTVGTWPNAPSFYTVLAQRPNIP